MFRRVGGFPALQEGMKMRDMLFTALQCDYILGFLLLLTGVFMVAWSLVSSVIITILYFVSTLLWAFVGWKAVCLERRKLLRLFFVAALVQPAYISIKFAQWLRMDGDTGSRSVFGM